MTILQEDHITTLQSVLIQKFKTYQLLAFVSKKGLIRLLGSKSVQNKMARLQSPKAKSIQVSKYSNITFIVNTYWEMSKNYQLSKQWFYLLENTGSPNPFGHVVLAW